MPLTPNIRSKLLSALEHAQRKNIVDLHNCSETEICCCECMVTHPCKIHIRCASLVYLCVHNYIVMYYKWILTYHNYIHDISDRLATLIFKVVTFGLPELAPQSGTGSVY